jgi:hypothetical protein
VERANVGCDAPLPLDASMPDRRDAAMPEREEAREGRVRGGGGGPIRTAPSCGEAVRVSVRGTASSGSLGSSLALAVAVSGAGDCTKGDPGDDMGLKSLLPLRANCGQTSNTISIASLKTTLMRCGVFWSWHRKTGKREINTPYGLLSW